MTREVPLDLAFRRFSLPLRRPLETAHGTIEGRDGFLVRVRHDVDDRSESVVGYGEATPLPGWTESLEECERGLERAMREIRTGGSDAALAAVDRTAAARHGVILALADLHATRRSIPLYQLLGEPGRVARVPVNATVGDGFPEETARAVRAAVGEGFGCCKVKAGIRSIETDVERLGRARDAVGPDVELRVDANGAWTLEEAKRAIEGFREYDVSILEQPLPEGALGGHAELRGLGVGIALDEGVLEHGIDAIREADAADAIVLKPMALGGVDVAREVAAWANEAGMPTIVTTTIDGVVARSGATHLAASIPNVPACGLATGPLLAEDLGRDPVLFENGEAVVPQAKGLGLSGIWND